jgi:hypothetical protein
LVAKKPADPLPTSRDLRRQRRHKKSKKGKGKGKGSGKGKGKGKDHKGGESPVEPPVEPPAAVPIVAPVATAAPVATPTAASNEQTVRLQDFFISYVAPEATREPTAAEYAEMLNRTSNYFQRYFENYYANDPNVEFVSINATIDFTRYGPDAGIPEARFNIYINFALTDLTFTADSTPPDAKALFDILAASTYGQDGVTYILTEVQTFFETTNEVFLSATEVAPP